MRDKVVEFRFATGGEVCIMRVSSMLCLFPTTREIRTIENGWTVQVCEEDWLKVVTAFLPV